MIYRILFAFAVMVICSVSSMLVAQTHDWNASTQATSHIVSSKAGTTIFNGVNINNRIGANAFYTAGFTGTRTIVANIEAGHVWSGHETLTHVTTFISGPGTPGVSNPALAYDAHATNVGQTIAGRLTSTNSGEWQRGIAYGSTLWSGAIATTFGSNGTFNTSIPSLSNPYHRAFVTGVGGQTADVINSSWGFDGDSAGRSAEARGYDGLVSQTGKIIVFSAGNSGPGANTVGGPSAGFNVISVGALGADTGTNTYNSVSSFSSRGPNDILIPDSAISSTGTTIAGARIRVDISAPGQDMTLAFYGGTTGGNTGGTASGTAASYISNRQGTSFSAPTVAGGIALMVDVAKSNSLTNGVDTRIVKSILLTTADKTSGWSNAQTNVGGVLTTTQALDPNVGAGRMNLARVLPLLNNATSTRDVTGTTQGNLGNVNRLGWDFGRVNRIGQNDYVVNTNLPIGSSINVTLNWLARRNSVFDANGVLTGIGEAGLANLDLEIWLMSGGVFTTKVASSSTLHNNTEHLSFLTTTDGQYGIRVDYIGDSWRFDGNTSELYGLAWEFTPVPEPAFLLVIAGAGLFVIRRFQGERST